MAILFTAIKAIRRSQGRRATAAAAYRAGERIRDERSGEVINYSKRTDVLHKEIFLPPELDGMSLSWARDRASLWNAAERAEKLRTSRVAREFQVALPFELDPGQRLALARRFARELAQRYNVAVDLAVHAPKPDGDQRNFHAHLLTTTREITATGLGRKTGLDMQGRERRRLGMISGYEEFHAIRQRWGEFINDALQAAKVAVRVDTQPYAGQAGRKEPRANVPWAAYRAEKRGVRNEIAERVRERYRARLQARLSAQTQRSQTAQTPKTLEAVKQEARQQWLKIRDKRVERTQCAATGIDDDFAM